MYQDFLAVVYVRLERPSVSQRLGRHARLRAFEHYRVASKHIMYTQEAGKSTKYRETNYPCPGPKDYTGLAVGGAARKEERGIIGQFWPCGWKTATAHSDGSQESAICDVGWGGEGSLCGGTNVLFWHSRFLH